jgi:hypothetical protein
MRASNMAIAGADWRALDRSIDGEVLLPDSEAYEWTRKPFIARFDEIKPRAVIGCAAAGDVREVIAFARNNGIHVACAAAVTLQLDIPRAEGS